MRGRMWIRLTVCSILLEGSDGVWDLCMEIYGVLRCGDLQHNVPAKGVMAVRHSSIRCR